ncbi:single-stranded-DNA-specific exonuclease RecJ [Rhodoplanes sp. TEM]|uniref:Single-stranded-DNA-specific exonuclease RecJ n=1 Tax=Rhodoplanes tepidamans TaxID=200616 RepID=A0ABT5JEA8_RHOTP|nr:MULTISPECIES: single-stranded-DNA-specific exonuclease RecJ [Rhodoplanes]MDC7788020.1 single-stranded-DNA-specific exonuclease RecJ [Rhodoplanes tepidamans]MDC7984860.1 single-stranded-DNA-specific exonuclease RecJ [Rhodoplanes sp. TEM]MDQ0358449.1 single-stranded-DNA-specific exonuclease [Rhodoplanes tepidamans]
MTPFLGVEKSATGRVWRDRLDERATQRAVAIVQRHGTPELLARVLAGRGVEPDDVPAHLDPTIRRLMPDPAVLTDMEPAAARLADAVERGERVTVFGDYDVDGATASALMTLVLRQCGLDPDIYIPDRIFEGYGPNVEAIRQIAARKTRLIVAVDCGTSSYEPLAEAKTLGVDVVVVDHHMADETLPPAVALVNPNRQDDLSRLGHLCAVGLVFMTVVALLRELRRRGFWSDLRPQPDLLEYVDIVALGTVADVVPLVGLNRAFVAKGLIGMKRRERVGLTALMDVSRLSGPPEAWHLGFLLGPRINAGGRIGRADLGARLLTLDDPVEAQTIAAELDRLNRERQVIEQAAVAEAEAEAMAALGLEEKGAVVVTAAAGWHPGVVGLVAARLKERFGRPAFAIAMEPGETGTGSGRSIPGVDLGRAVKRALQEGLLVKGGGHAMAAGVTLRKTALGAFRAFLEEALAPAVEIARRDHALKIDGAVSAAAVTPDLCRTLAQAGPYGSGNPEPVLALPSHTVAYADEVGQAHVKLRLKGGDGAFVEAIAFRAAGQPLGRALLESRGRRVHVAGCLAVDRWQGAEKAQLRVLDVANGDPTSLR